MKVINTARSMMPTDVEEDSPVAIVDKDEASSSSSNSVEIASPFLIPKNLMGTNTVSDTVTKSPEVRKLRSK